MELTLIDNGSTRTMYFKLKRVALFQKFISKS